MTCAPEDAFMIPWYFLSWCVKVVAWLCRVFFAPFPDLPKALILSLLTNTKSTKDTVPTGTKTPWYVFPKIGIGQLVCWYRNLDDLSIVIDKIGVSIQQTSSQI